MVYCVFYDRVLNGRLLGSWQSTTYRISKQARASKPAGGRVLAEHVHAETGRLFLDKP
jgi:hypothetical protein